MIENEKLKLENQDLVVNKSKYQRSKGDNESKLKNIEIDLKITQDENKKLKLQMKHTETQMKYETDELKRELDSLRESFKRCQEENDKFRGFLQERSKSYAKKEYPDYEKQSQTNYENQRKRVQELLNYRNQKEGEGDISHNYGNKNGSKWSITEVDDEYSNVSETPSRIYFQPSSEEAFLRSSQRKYVKNYNHPQEKNSEEGSKSKSSNEKDRSVYAGFKENENSSTSSKDQEYSEYQQKLMMSIERRVGGKQDVIL
jgi:hypothetical protein